MKQIIWATACCAFLSSCVSVDPFPDRSCLEVVDSVKPLPGVKVSPQLRSTQVAACYYGLFKTEGEHECVTNPYFKDYLSGADDFQFKTRVGEVLIASESFGDQIANEQILWGIRHGDYVDTEACLKSIHDVPENYETLLKHTRELITLGY